MLEPHYISRSCSTALNGSIISDQTPIFSLDLQHTISVMRHWNNLTGISKFVKSSLADVSRALSCIVLVTVIALRRRRRRTSASNRGFIVVSRADTRQFMRHRGETEYEDECSTFSPSQCKPATQSDLWYIEFHCPGPLIMIVGKITARRW